PDPPAHDRDGMDGHRPARQLGGEPACRGMRGGGQVGVPHRRRSAPDPARDELARQPDLHLLMAARIPPLSPEEFHAVEEERDLPRVGINHLVRTLVHNPPLYEGWVRFGRMLKDALDDPRDRELVILRSAYRSRSPYEWGHHAVIALGAGLSDAEILRV